MQGLAFCNTYRLAAPFPLRLLGFLRCAAGVITITGVGSRGVGGSRVSLRLGARVHGLVALVVVLGRVLLVDRHLL